MVDANESVCFYANLRLEAPWGLFMSGQCPARLEYGLVYHGLPLVVHFQLKF
jgi:hypothetical protein